LYGQQTIIELGEFEMGILFLILTSKKLGLFKLKKGLTITVRPHFCGVDPSSIKIISAGQARLPENSGRPQA